MRNLDVFDYATSPASGTYYLVNGNDWSLCYLKAGLLEVEGAYGRFSSS